MKKIVRLTESELKNIVEASVKRTINEGLITEEMLNEGIKEKAVELAKIAGVSVAVAAGWLTALGFGAFDQQGKTIDDNSRAFQVDREEYGDALNPANQNNDTTAMNKFGAYEERIKGAVMESIMNLMNEGKPADTQK